jgi:uncharacterized protein (DUF1800 family)
MALDPKTEAAIALHRFGLGPRSGAIAAIASDPRGALLAELERAGAGRISDPNLLTSGEAARLVFDFRQAQRAASAALDTRQPQRAVSLAERAEREAEQRAARNNSPADSTMQPRAPAQSQRINLGNAIPQQIYLEEARARLGAALDAQIGFAERLAWFWSNHFCVSADKGQVRPIAGAYEREAIRANLRGRFADMLIAVETHPAMLMYLDNAGSIGPNSVAGKNSGRGLNENLAREILELHTLGVRTVYTQDDVTRFANVITGWTVVPPRQDPVRAGTFTFNERMHQPGAQTIIGKDYPDTGYGQGRAVLAALARHPATAKHIATKLARHFVADDPPLALVERLTRRYLDTDGDLKELAKALVAAPEAWASPPAKLKRPGEWIVGALRASGVKEPNIPPVMQAQNMLGERLWRPPAPNGFADDDATWLDGLAQRLDVANQLARRLGDSLDPRAVFDESIAPLASAETRQTIARAESRPQALALLFMAPEFQRR